MYITTYQINKPNIVWFIKIQVSNYNKINPQGPVFYIILFYFILDTSSISRCIVYPTYSPIILLPALVLWAIHVAFTCSDQCLYGPPKVNLRELIIIPGC